jgi:hypothetical protein
MTRRGSVHAGPTHLRCPSPVPERQHPTAPDSGRDARVTTQTTTQNSPATGRSRSSYATEPETSRVVQQRGAWVDGDASSRVSVLSALNFFFGGPRGGQPPQSCHSLKCCYKIWTSAQEGPPRSFRDPDTLYDVAEAKFDHNESIPRRGPSARRKASPLSIPRSAARPRCSRSALF